MEGASPLQLDGPEGDILATKPPPIVGAAGGIVLGAGVLAVLVGVQMWSGFHVSLVTTLLLGGLAVVGVATGACGLMIMRAREWAAIGGTGVSGLLTLVAGAWLLLSARSGLISLFGLFLPFLALLATGLSAASIGPCKRASVARARLRAQGLDIGT
jgi:hypothetical protein